MGTVGIEIPGGQTLTATVTMDAINELGVGIGSAVDALVKSTDISVATSDTAGLSIRNKLRGTLVEVGSGGAMAVAHIALDDGHEITAAITRAAVDELGLVPGTQVTALIKSTEVSFSAA
jgi:molybdate transport system regulatory protein